MEEKKLIGVFIENNSNFLDKYKCHLNENFTISIFPDTNSALPYIVENNTSIMFCIIRWSLESEELIKYFIEKVNAINPTIKIAIIETADTFASYYGNITKNYNTISFTKNEDPKDICKTVMSSIPNDSKPRRQYSRVNWPLNVAISFSDKTKPKIERNILSISGNGAYVCSDTNMPQKGDTLGLTISFKDFKLFTEARVVWNNEDNKKPEYPNGFAVSFVDIGLASQKIIDSIIRDKLLQDTLIEHKDENL